MPVTYPTPEPFEFSLNGYLRNELQIPVFPLRIPQNVVASAVRLVYTPISGSYDIRLAGASGLSYCNIQFDLYANNFEDVLVVEQQLRFALQDFEGWMGGTWVLNAFALPQPSNFTPLADKSDNGTWRRTVEYQFRYRSDVPTRETISEE